MSSTQIFIFIVFLPVIFVLGHDIYLFTQDSSVDELTAAFSGKGRSITSFFADAGFLWTKYHPESYKTLAENLTTEQWSIVSKVLSYTAIILALIVSALTSLLVFVPRFARPNKKRNTIKVKNTKTVDDLLGREEEQKTKYKRK